MNPEDINWSQVTFVLDELFYSQYEIADMCGVSQQAVQQWRSQIRKPGSKAMTVLSGILDGAGVSLEVFTPRRDRIEDAALLELIAIYRELGAHDREMLLEYGRFERLQIHCNSSKFIG